MTNKDKIPFGLHCQACNGTGRYIPNLMTELYKAKKHNHEGSCYKCGQHFSHDDLEWLRDRLKKVEEELRFISNWKVQKMEENLKPWKK